VIPLCTGWFGEMNEDFDKIIKSIVREAGLGDNGLWIFLLSNTNKIGGIYNIILNQFRRAIRCAIIRGHVQHKLRSLYYAQAISAEAASVYSCRANHSKSNWRSLQHSKQHGTPPTHQKGTPL